MKASREELEKALEGSWAEHHLFSLSQALSAYDFFGDRLRECDARIDETMGRLTGKGPKEPPSRKPRKNQPGFDLGGRLEDLLGTDATSVPGVDAQTLMAVVSELGWDLSRFPTEKHFASYLGLAPSTKVTGGRRRGGPTRKVASRAATALRIAAQSVGRSGTALGGFHRRLKARLGPAKATTATARKIAVALYRLLRHGVLYRELGAEAYSIAVKEQRLKELDRKARALGHVLLPEAA